MLKNCSRDRFWSSFFRAGHSCQTFKKCWGSQNFDHPGEYIREVYLVIFCIYNSTKKRSQLLEVTLSSAFKVYLVKRSILSSAFWGIFWKKVHFIDCFWDIFWNQFYPVLLRYILEVHFIQGFFRYIFWKSILSSAI